MELQFQGFEHFADICIKRNNFVTNNTIFSINTNRIIINKELSILKEKIIDILFNSIFGAVAGGLVSFLNDKRKERREDKKEAKKEQKERFVNRPEFKIIGYKQCFDSNSEAIESICDINVFFADIKGVTVDNFAHAQYHLEDITKEDWRCVIYEFCNVGKTDVVCLYPASTEKRHFALLNTDSIELYIKNGFLKYSEGYDTKIRMGESFTLKICFHKDRPISNDAFALMELLFEDSNGCFWEQPLFAYFNKIYDARQISHQEYHDELSSEMAIKCFEKPSLW